MRKKKHKNEQESCVGVMFKDEMCTKRILRSSSLWSGLDTARLLCGLTELSYEGTMEPERSRDKLVTLADLQREMTNM